MKVYELDHWVLFDTLKPEQINRLKTVIDNKITPATPAADQPAKNSFLSMLNTETDKLDGK